jgi:hypothetical protein
MRPFPIGAYCQQTLFWLGLSLGTAWSQPTQTVSQAQQRYQASIAQLRKQYASVPDFSAATDYRFGMGTRRKLRYENGTLRDVRTDEVIHHWETRREIILPSEYTVLLQTRRGTWITIRENQTGVLIRQGTVEAYLTRSPLRLPTFRDHAYAPVLRVLHHAVLLQVSEGLDSLGTEVLRRTGNADEGTTAGGTGTPAARWFLRLWDEKSPAR